MSSDFTEQQTMGEQMRAEELSLRTTTPPAEVPGYRLERLLGQGAFGQVWVGKNLNTGRTVAVKFYLHRGGVDWSLLAREVKHLVSMSANRYIVQVLEVGWDAEPPYYVMEYLENGSLDDLIRSRGVLAVGQASEIFSDLATGLNHSHGKGVLHCDLKPANVLLDADMRPRLADFGQSRMSHEQTPSLGTLFYMAPEQADLSAAPDARWDVYALGAILYCMVCGAPPYRTPQMVNTLDTAASLPDRLKRYRDSIMRTPSPRQHYRVRGMDRELAAIVDRCLAKNPDHRLANVQQVLEALEKRQLSKTRRPLMLLGIVGPLLLLAVMGFFSWRGFSVAATESSEQLLSDAQRTDAFAANFVAQSLETEFVGLFQLLGEETNRVDFRKLLDDVLVEAENTESPKTNGSESSIGLLDELAKGTDRQESILKFRELPSQNALQSHLKKRLEKRSQVQDNRPNPAKFSSIFVVDSRGTNLATAFNEQMDETPVGKNFAYRTYFTGLPQDLSPKFDRSNVKPILSQFVSSPFRSTSTGRSKIAVCTPIFKNDEETKANFLGLMVLTINVGEFLALSRGTLDDEVKNLFAVLIDGNGGDILQHPLLLRPDRQKKEQFKIDEEQFSLLKKQDSGILGYQDPVAKSEDGAPYRGSWIAVVRRVEFSARAGLSASEGEQSKTDLWVLVQTKSDDVTAPVVKLGNKLVREGLIALVSLLTVICALWIFVLRLLRLSDTNSSASRGRTSGDTGAGSEVTLTAD